MQKLTNRPSILLVDDDLLSREMLKFALADDFVLEEVNSGEACLVSVAKKIPQLVVMDIEMPGWWV